MRLLERSLPTSKRSRFKGKLWICDRDRLLAGVRHGAADATGADGGRVILAEGAFDQTHAGLRERVVRFPKFGGFSDGGDLGGLGFDFGGFRFVGGFGAVFEAGDPLGGIGGVGDHIGLVFLEETGDLAGVILLFCVGEC